MSRFDVSACTCIAVSRGDPCGSPRCIWLGDAIDVPPRSPEERSRDAMALYVQQYDDAIIRAHGIPPMQIARKASSGPGWPRETHPEGAHGLHYDGAGRCWVMDSDDRWWVQPRPDTSWYPSFPETMRAGTTYTTHYSGPGGLPAGGGGGSVAVSVNTCDAGGRGDKCRHCGCGLDRDGLADTAGPLSVFCTANGPRHEAGTLPPGERLDSIAAARAAEAETEWRWSICTDCGTWDLVTGLRDPLCAYCAELRSLPPARLMRTRTRRLLIAAVWTCAVAAGVLIWFVPELARIVTLVTWPLAIAAWAVIGWRALGRRRRGN